MHICVRYALYGLLFTLGACAMGPGFSENRSEWGTLFADATSGKYKADNNLDAIGKNKR